MYLFFASFLLALLSQCLILAYYHHCNVGVYNVGRSMTYSSLKYILLSWTWLIVPVNCLFKINKQILHYSFSCIGIVSDNISWKPEAFNYRPLVIFSPSQISKTCTFKPFLSYSSSIFSLIPPVVFFLILYHKASCHTEIPISVLLWCFHHKTV